MKIVIDPGAYLPERAHDLDAGYDLRSPIRAYVPPYSSAIIDTGVHILYNSMNECAALLPRLIDKLNSIYLPISS